MAARNEPDESHWAGNTAGTFGIGSRQLQPRRTCLAPSLSSGAVQGHWEWLAQLALGGHFNSPLHPALKPLVRNREGSRLLLQTSERELTRAAQEREAEEGLLMRANHRGRIIQGLHVQCTSLVFSQEIHITGFFPGNSRCHFGTLKLDMGKADKRGVQSYRGRVS